MNSPFMNTLVPDDTRDFLLQKDAAARQTTLFGFRLV